LAQETGGRFEDWRSNRRRGMLQGRAVARWGWERLESSSSHVVSKYHQGGKRALYKVVGYRNTRTKSRNDASSVENLCWGIVASRNPDRCDTTCLNQTNPNAQTEVQTQFLILGGQRRRNHATLCYIILRFSFFSFIMG
jgi:hypothetical protein